MPSTSSRWLSACVALALSLRLFPALAQTAACPKLYPSGTVPFTGLYPAIEKRLPLATFEPGQIVEIDPDTMSEAEARAHIAELQGLPARVSIYVAGGHCTTYKGDCERLTRAGVRLGPTGSWNWDKDERRILDITHRVVVERIVDQAERGWRLGANYIRVDNLHHPAGSAEPRTAPQMKEIFAALLALEDIMRERNLIPPERPTGVVAHNNLHVWEELIRTAALKRPPVFLTSERTGQLADKGQGYAGDAKLKAGRLSPLDVEEISAGRRIARALGLPYSIAEFQTSHDLGAKPETTYQLPARYVQDLVKLPGVTEVFVIDSESHYVGRGKVHRGAGPRTLSAAPWPTDSRWIAANCVIK